MLITHHRRHCEGTKAGWTGSERKRQSDRAVGLIPFVSTEWRYIPLWIGRVNFPWREVGKVATAWRSVQGIKYHDPSLISIKALMAMPCRVASPPTHQTLRIRMGSSILMDGVTVMECCWRGREEDVSSDRCLVRTASERVVRDDPPRCGRVGLGILVWLLSLNLSFCPFRYFSRSSYMPRWDVNLGFTVAHSSPSAKN